MSLFHCPFLFFDLALALLFIAEGSNLLLFRLDSLQLPLLGSLLSLRMRRLFDSFSGFAPLLLCP